MKKILNFLTNTKQQMGNSHFPLIPTALSSFLKITDLGSIRAYQIDNLMAAIGKQNPQLNCQSLRVVDWENVVENQLTTVAIRSDLHSGMVLVNFYVILWPLILSNDDNGNWIGVGESRSRMIKNYAKLYHPQVHASNPEIIKGELINGNLQITGGRKVPLKESECQQTLTLTCGDPQTPTTLTLKFYLVHNFAISSAIVKNDLGELLDHRDGAIIQKIINLNPALQGGKLTITGHDFLSREVQVTTEKYYGLGRFYYTFEDDVELNTMPCNLQRSAPRWEPLFRFQKNFKD